MAALGRQARRLPHAQHYSLADIQRRTGVPARTLQFWADAQIILAEGTTHPGRGIHRRYPQSELVVVAVMTPLAKAGIQIGGLVPWANFLRDRINTPDIRRIVLRAANREGFNLLAMARNEGHVIIAPVTDDKFDVARFIRSLPFRADLVFCLDLQVMAGIFDTG